MKVVLMHGKDADPTQKWYPWLATEMRKFGVEFVAPVLPNASDPSLDEWIAELEQTKPDHETILIGHSRGGVAILRWLEKLAPSQRMQKVILVGANAGSIKMNIGTESNKGFYTESGYDFKKIRSHCDNFVILHSHDDQWVPFAAGEENAGGLHAKFLTFDDRGHFGKGVDVIPELLEEIIHFDHRKALLIPLNSRRQVLIQDRRGHKKPDWGYFGGEIEQGETPLMAVIREAKEELNLDIRPEELQYLGWSAVLWKNYKNSRYMYLYRTDQNEFPILEGAGAHWFTYEEVLEHLEKEDQFADVMVRIEKVL